MKTDLRIRLTPLEFGNWVNVQTEEECNLLMQIYRCAGMRWRGNYPKPGNNATNHRFYFRYKENTIVSTPHKPYQGWDFVSNLIQYYYKSDSYDNKTLLSLEEFIKIQEIPKKQIKKIKRYFKKHPNKK